MITSATHIEEILADLASRLRFIEAELREQSARRAMWEDLGADLAPAAKDAIKVAAREPDELIRLLESLVRDVGTIERTLERFESVMDLLDDAGPLGREIFSRVLQTLDEVDRRGYFGFTLAGLGVIDRVVGHFGEDEVARLGDNIVLILETVKELTQPEIIALVHRMVEAVRRQQAAIRTAPDDPPSLWHLLRRLGDPGVRRGLGRALDTLGAVSSMDPGTPPDSITAQEITTTKEGDT